jgi:tripartite-type tricarboxylate transporter receptor subunit TctC
MRLNNSSTIKTLVLGASVVALSGLSAGPAAAQFYKGKTLNVIINYGAGGNTDVQGRSVLRFMDKHIPGKPRTVVRNMPGAGGVVATNYIVKAAKKDGSVMGIFTIAGMAELTQAKELTVSHKDLIFIGAIGQQQIGHIRKDVLDGGINKPADILKVTKVFKTAGHAPTSSKDLSIRLTLRLLGIKHQHVTGFKGANSIRRAILQNGIQYSEDSMTGYYNGVVPLLIKPGVSVPIFHTGVPTADGGLAHSDTVPKNIPTFLALYQAKHGAGKMPEPLAWGTYRKFAQMRQVLRILILPKGAPRAAINDLRSAWAKTTKDPGYLAEYKKQNASELVPLVGDDAQAVVNDLLTIKPDVQKFMQTLVVR